MTRLVRIVPILVTQLHNTFPISWQASHQTQFGKSRGYINSQMVRQFVGDILVLCESYIAKTYKSNSNVKLHLVTWKLTLNTRTPKPNCCYIQTFQILRCLRIIFVHLIRSANISCAEYYILLSHKSTSVRCAIIFVCFTISWSWLWCFSRGLNCNRSSSKNIFIFACRL